MENIPAALLQSLEKRKDFSKDSFLKAHDQEAVISFRKNPLKTSQQEVFFTDEKQIPWHPYGYYLDERPSFVMDPLLHAGAYYVQEASSMFIWQVLAQLQLSTQSKVLDLCAAPGGKTTLLASYFSDGLIVANEVIKSRASILVENATKWGSGNIVVSNNDPKHFSRLRGYFDVMLVDAPCSGSGLFRKESDWREGWSEANVNLCCQRQKRILLDAFESLKQNGILIYATCSFSQEEDEDIVDWILDQFEVENIQLKIDESWGIEPTQSDKHRAISYRFYPGKTIGEGFFICVFRKKSTTDQVYISSSEKQILISENEKDIVKKWLQSPENLHIYKNKQYFYAINASFSLDIAFLKNHLYLRKGGTEIGEIKGKDLIPSNELALSMLTSENIPKYELTLDQAIQYLRKAEIERSENLPNGWTLITYKNRNLGWTKVLPNRVNNYYPIEWRIRKQ